MNTQHTRRGVIYCYHCIGNGKKYIGQTINENNRKTTHIYNVKHNKYPHLPFYCAVTKYGWKQFIYGIIEECDQQQLNDRESYWITRYDTLNDGYNAHPGGKVLSPTMETREKMRQSRLGKSNTQHQKNVARKLFTDHNPRKSTWCIYFKDGHTEIVEYPTRWCKENGYNFNTLKNRIKRKTLNPRTHPEIIKVKLL